MARISEPQIVEALTSIRTSPWPGSGTGTVLNSTVLFPGRKAAFIVFDIWPISSCVVFRSSLSPLPDRLRMGEPTKFREGEAFRSRLAFSAAATRE
jgi:hypothetical protein